MTTQSDDAYLIVNSTIITFVRRPEQNVSPAGHADICKTALISLGHVVEGPFEKTPPNGELAAHTL